jgi:hypothetical protein
VAVGFLDILGTTSPRAPHPDHSTRLHQDTSGDRGRHAQDARGCCGTLAVWLKPNQHAACSGCSAWRWLLCAISSIELLCAHTLA